MKISIIASGDYFSTYGGGQVYVKNLVKGLLQKGHEVNVVSVSFGMDSSKLTKEIQNVDGIEVWQIGLSSNSLDVDKPMELQDVMLEMLNDVLFEIDPDVVHANGWKYATSKVCNEMNIPCVVTAHHGGIVCPNGMLMNQDDSICDIHTSMENCLNCALHFVPGGDFWSPIVNRLPYAFSQNIGKSLKRIRNIPYVSPAFQTPLSITYKLQQIEVLRSDPACVIAPSHAIASALIKNGVPESKIKIIPHGIKPFEKKPLESGLPNSPLRFGYVGRISYVKGLHVVIEGLNILPKYANYELHIYGDAANKSEKKYRDMLKEKSKNLPVIWHGKVDYNQINETYSSFDVMILPSICLEVFGLTVLESLSSGRPVISTRCGGPEDLIKDGFDGIFVEPNDAYALSQAMNKFINENTFIEEISLTIGKINTLEHHLGDIENIYKELLDNKNE